MPSRSREGIGTFLIRECVNEIDVQLSGRFEEAYLVGEQRHLL